MRIGRRSFIAGMGTLGVTTLGLGISACSAPPRSALAPSKVRRIGYLSNANAAADPTQNAPSLSKSFRELGYVEGEDLIIEARFSEGARDRLPALAAELVALRVDVLVTAGGPNSALAAKQATETIPVIFTSVSDPVGLGIVANFARPGGNLTGVASALIQGKRLELLKETVPGLGRVVVLFNETDLGAALNLEANQDAATSLGITSVPVALNTPADLDDALNAVARHRPDGLVDTHGTMFYGRGFASLGKVLDFAIKHRLPQTYNGVDFARAGGLMALGENVEARWRSVAKLVDRILQGAYPGDLPVEVTSVFDLALNLGMAQKIDLDIPESVLRQATEVIQ